MKSSFLNPKILLPHLLRTSSLKIYWYWLFRNGCIIFRNCCSEMKVWDHIFNFLYNVHERKISNDTFICHQRLGHLSSIFKGLCIQRRLLHVRLLVLKAWSHFGHVNEGYGTKRTRIWSCFGRVPHGDRYYAILISNGVLLPTYLYLLRNNYMA